MKPQENREWERKLQELEAEIKQAPPQPQVQTQPGQPLTRQDNDSPSIRSLFNQIANWFNGLPSTAKIVAIAIAFLVGFAVMRTVLQLVASIISLAILGVLLYLVYKFLIAPKAS